MLNELISKEENKIIRYQELKEKLRTLNENEQTLEEKMYEYQLPVPFKDRRFNFFQKLFSRKYKEYIENYEKMKKQYDEKKKELKRKIKQLDSEICCCKYEISQIDIEEVYKNVSTFKDKKRAVQHFLEAQPELSTNIEFMKEAIEIDISFIAFDRTNNKELYLYVLEKNKEQAEVLYNNDDGHQKLRHKEEIYRIQQEILNPSEVPKGRYKIPTKYIFEAIRTDIESDKFLYLTRSYLKLDGRYTEEFGKQIQEMWEDDKNIFTVHGISRNFIVNSEDDRVEAEKKCMNIVMNIFDKGLKATNAMGEMNGKYATPKLEATAKHKGQEGFCMLMAIDYSYASSYGYIIMQIPKEGLGKNATLPIWGTNTMDNDRGEKVFLLPKYVKGFVKNNGSMPKDEKHCIIRNDLQECQEYQYFLMDQSYGITEMEALTEESLYSQSR